MPAKGWRKTPDGIFIPKDSEIPAPISTPVSISDPDKISIDSILFPKATVSKLIKQVINPQESDAQFTSSSSSSSPSSLILSKDSLTAVQRASVVFVNHIYFYAKRHAVYANRKGVNAQDVLSALEDIDFTSFADVLTEELDHFNKRKAAKKLEKLKNSSNGESSNNKSNRGRRKKNTENGDGDGEDEDEEDEEEEDDEEDDDDDDEEVTEDIDGGEVKNKKVTRLNDDKMDTTTDNDATQSNIEDEGEEEEEDGVDDNEPRIVTASQRLQQEQRELEGENVDDENGQDAIIQDKDGFDEEDD